jgi:hypothetical protein
MPNIISGIDKGKGSLSQNYTVYKGKGIMRNYLLIKKMEKFNKKTILDSKLFGIP